MNRLGVYGLALLACWSPLAALASCGGTHCDPGWTYSHRRGACVPEPSEAGGGQGGATGAPSQAAGAPSQAAGAPPAVAGAAGSSADCTTSTLDGPCQDAGDCTCDADFCAAMPGQTGYCTRQGCLEDPTLCPNGWSCLDLGIYSPGLSMCARP